MPTVMVADVFQTVGKNTGMGDHLWAVIQSQYVTIYLARLLAIFHVIALLLLLRCDGGDFCHVQVHGFTGVDSDRKHSYSTCHYLTA